LKLQQQQQKQQQQQQLVHQNKFEKKRTFSTAHFEFQESFL